MDTLKKLFEKIPPIPQAKQLFLPTLICPSYNLDTLPWGKLWGRFSLNFV